MNQKIMKGYRSGVAARLAGLPVETLRVWERRYGENTRFAPRRDGKSHRGAVPLLRQRHGAATARTWLPGGALAVGCIGSGGVVQHRRHRRRAATARAGQAGRAAPPER